MAIAAAASSPSLSVARVWRVEKNGCQAETVVAHLCEVLQSGVLVFHSAPDDYLLVRAFAARDWHDVQLVEIGVPRERRP